MAQLKDLIVSGVTRCVGKLYAPDIVGNLTGTASRATADQNGATIDSTYIKSISYSGVSMTVTKGDDTSTTFDVRGTEYSQATDSTLGLVKLYSSTGDNTDGTMTQSDITSAINAVYVSPAFTGNATAPTVADSSDNSTKIATTAFTQAAIQQAIEDMLESGVFKATAATADGQNIVTATDFDLLTFSVTVSDDV